MNKNTVTASSVFSLILSFLATSHHWLHMGVLTLFGSSSSMMETMSTVFWLRRAMIIITLLMLAFTIYRLYRHRCKDLRIVTMTVLSTVISLGLIGNTLYKFGW